MLINCLKIEKNYENHTDTLLLEFAVITLVEIVKFLTTNNPFQSKLGFFLAMNWLNQGVAAFCLASIRNEVTYERAMRRRILYIDAPYEN